jgi:pheromone alpha factor receptor
MALTAVCIFLPLSAIWAGVANENASTSGGPDALFRGEKSSRVGSNASTTMVNNSRQLSICTCKGIDSIATTPSPRKKSVLEYEDDANLIGRDFGFSRGDAGDRV